MPKNPETPPLPGLELPSLAPDLPTREAGLKRLHAFMPRAGKHYASKRNFDFGVTDRTNVSALSPWLRHRLITEEEVLHATLARHAITTAEKFVQEVFWRGYFKGWLEQRPSVWNNYQSDLAHALRTMADNASLAADYDAACKGRTGFAAFDHWARELVETGYLHNHARMWFASIWIFTLRLPWELGADFFLQHLLDGDPASNTLSWRWVGGLHTKGRVYQARADNIARYTDGRFPQTRGLTSDPMPLIERHDTPLRPIPMAGSMPEEEYLLLLTEEDCAIDRRLTHPPGEVIALTGIENRSPSGIGQPALSFTRGAVADVQRRLGRPEGIGQHSGTSWADQIADVASAAKLRHVVTTYAPVGPVADELKIASEKLAQQGIQVHQIRRKYDDLVWPHATKGFFALKKQIPRILQTLSR